MASPERCSPSWASSVESRGESDDRIADAYAAEIWRQLPKELQEAVTNVYTKTGKSQGDFHMGHEFFRMLSQHDTSLEGGKLIYKGKVLTEQTIGEKVVSEIRNYLRRRFSFRFAASCAAAVAAMPEGSFDLELCARNSGGCRGCR